MEEEYLADETELLVKRIQVVNAGFVHGGRLVGGVRDGCDGGCSEAIVACLDLVEDLLDVGYLPAVRLLDQRLQDHRHALLDLFDLGVLFQGVDLSVVRQETDRVRQAHLWQNARPLHVRLDLLLLIAGVGGTDARDQAGVDLLNPGAPLPVRVEAVEREHGHVVDGQLHRLETTAQLLDEDVTHVRHRVDEETGQHVEALGGDEGLEGGLLSELKQLVAADGAETGALGLGDGQRRVIGRS